MATDSDSGGRRGFAAYLPLIVALLVMPGVAYLTLKYLPELKTLQRQAADASTNQPSAKPTNQFKLLKQKAAPRMPVPIADGQLGFDPDVSKEPGPVRLVLTNAPNVSNFTMTLRLADRNRPRHALVELFMLGENTDELIAKANLANSKDPGLDPEHHQPAEWQNGRQPPQAGFSKRPSHRVAGAMQSIDGLEYRARDINYGFGRSVAAIIFRWDPR